MYSGKRYHSMSWFTWHGLAGQGWVWYGEAWRGAAWLGPAWRGKAWRDKGRGLRLKGGAFFMAGVGRADGEASAMTPEEKQRIFDEEKERDNARQKIAFQRQYGGIFGKLLFGMEGCLAFVQIFLGLFVLVILGWLIWAVFIPHH